MVINLTNTGRVMRRCMQMKLARCPGIFNIMHAEIIGERSYRIHGTEKHSHFVGTPAITEMLISQNQ